MELWPILISAAVATAGALALLVAGLLLPVLARHQRLKTIPTPPKRHWLLGHPGVVESCDRAPWVLHAYAKKLGRIFRLRVVHWHFVVVTDPAEALRLTSRGEDYLDKSPDLYVNAFNMVHGDIKAYNIVSWHTGPEWRAIRKATSPAFSAANVRAAMPLMLELVDSIARQWEAAGPVKAWDLLDVCKRITLDTITGWGYGDNVNSVAELDTPHAVVDIVDNLTHAMHSVLIDPLYKFKPWSKTVRKGLSDLAEYDAWMEKFTQRLLERKDTLPTNCIGRALIELEDPSLGGKLDGKQLVSNVAIFFVAGYETTATSMTMTLMLLLRHPEWLQRVEAELDVAGLLKTPARRQPRNPTAADMNELPVLNAVIKESHRLLPPTALGSFRCTKAYTEICGHTVPAGCIVMFPTLPVDSASWSYGEDAEEFKPDRWLAKGATGASRWEEDSTGGKIHIHASAVSQPQPRDSPADAAPVKEPYVFSAGPRDCIGQPLARLEIQVLLAALLSRFRLQLAPSMGTPQQALDSLIYHVTVRAEHGAWVTAEAR